MGGGLLSASQSSTSILLMERSIEPKFVLAGSEGAYSHMDDISYVHILKCLQDRKHELAVHSVTNDCDVDAMKGLLTSGHLKRMLITPKKQQM